MTNLPRFQQLVSELLQNIGFQLEQPPEDQDLFSLSVDDNFVLHLGLLDDNHWFALAELQEQVAPHAPLNDWLRHNALSDQAQQPVIALDEENHPCCYLRLPLEGMNLPEVMETFNQMLAQADMLCGKTG
jgi:hypothetical protein